MLKRLFHIFAALVLFSGCHPFNTEEEPSYSITGEIIDPDASLSRLLADMHVIATDKLSGKSYAGSVGSEDAVTCRYSLKDVPSGEYVLLFSSRYYEAAEYSLNLKGDRILDVTLSPIPQVSLDVQEIRIVPREKSKVFSLTNLTDREISLELKPDFEISMFIEKISGLQKMSGTSGWRCNMAPGETKQLTIQAKHDDEVSVREGLIAINVDGFYQSSLPFAVETSSRDLYANLVGRVTDQKGNPLKDIPVYCNCTETIVLTDEDGRYSFDDLPYVSQVSVIALSEFYNWKQSEFKEYVRDEIELDLALEPCTNHLTLDRKEIDFGTGSVSNPGNPVSFEINVTAETDEPVSFLVQTKVIGGDVYPGLHYLANGMFYSSIKLWFQLDRSAANVGDFAFTAILKTDSAGVYLIPIRFSNTE